MGMRALDCEFDHETFEEMLSAGRHHEAQVISYCINRKKFRHAIRSGREDHVSVYKSGNQVFVVSVHLGLDYVGVDRYEDGDLTGEFFDENNEHEWLDLAPYNIAKRASEYM